MISSIVGYDMMSFDDDQQPMMRMCETGEKMTQPLENDEQGFWIVLSLASRLSMVQCTTFYITVTQ